MPPKRKPKKRAAPKRKHKFPNTPGLKRGAKSKPVAELQEFLQAFGYLRMAEPGQPRPRGRSPFATTELAGMPIPAAVAATGSFDPATESGLTNFQRFLGLPITGELDIATVAEMSKPRCGVPDLLPRVVGPFGFAAPGNRWPRTQLSYSFDESINTVPGVSAQLIRGGIRAALDLWSAATPLRFTASTGTGDLKFRFAAGDHGDGNSFDGQGRVLAHAFLPSGNPMDGEVHFDVEERWSCSFETEMDLVTVATHEIGHALGLDHSQVRGSMMFPTYAGPQRFLHDDDIQGIRTLYP